ncbi:transcriptional regulator, LacI family protein [Paenibacillus vortex V453]|jgi:LacI family transcriptional regulator|uniref:LacI family transcriptional regulator n=2 Tax=Paenibacillus TaxID=44249 RepID=A0A163IBE0_9BACL|nr:MULTISPECIES: LacI family DNA-binding transcriptional regulator [Paenibacillus]ANA79854.1 LacI family transcriptional regulator [Paenibacillus glucanolyticus]AVV56122.1 LacI family transcriptional regulator [Paenibacillus glucanolyticus]AWP30658.1 LacI family transcriptional regulator [Paenibacillus sp. Cedars]EFU38093.1 transcriptional regulator, LacI family protein [Paenibacillus vortex V453]ETT38234.1 LacI family transcriptional regulator [Paenibacillus sp. FSL R5-808]
MATIKDVAKLAGVALSTASYALSGDSRVSSKTRSKVLDAARQLNYRKNGFAMDLKRSRTKTIALILTDLSGPYYSELIRSVQEVALTNGYDLIACSSMGGRDSTAVKFLREKRADGAIILAPNIRDEVLVETSGPQFPIVVMDRQLSSDYLLNVLVDGEQGGYTATRYLLENGHKHVAYISGSSDSYDNHLRYKGYLRALAEAGLEEQSKWRLSGNFVREGGYNATKMLIMQGSLPSAVFYGNDEMAIGGLKAFEECGISVPNDISVIGYDDIQLAEYVNPPLTTIRQPKSEAGSLAAHLLFQALAGESVKQSYMLTTDMMERASVGKGKAGN